MNVHLLNGPCLPPPPSNVDPEPPTPHLATPTAVCCLTYPPGNTQGFLAAWAQRGTLSFKQVEEGEKKKSAGVNRAEAPSPKMSRVAVGRGWWGGSWRKSHNTCSICRHGWLHILLRSALTRSANSSFMFVSYVFITQEGRKKNRRRRRKKKTRYRILDEEEKRYSGTCAACLQCSVGGLQ